MNIETANRLLQYRKQHGLSQEALAEKIGVSRQAISKWERAEASPDTDNLILLADIYGVSLDELLKGESSDTEKTESKTPAPDSDTTYVKKDKVSFKNGIHVDSKDGDQVHISFRDGIHVHDKHGATVDINGSGIHVNDGKKQKVYTDENGNVMVDEDFKKYHNHKAGIWYKFPIYLFVIIAFLWWGFSGVCFGWALSWICFLAIPLYYSLVDSIYKRNPHHFAYPVFTVGAYMIFGFFNVCGGWAYGWIIFLTIPLYYWVCSLFKNKPDDDCH